MEYTKIAQKFVNRMKKLFNIDMNIINEKGIIIASSQLERIGDFHEMAYHMIENNIPYTYNEKLDENLKGVRTGVNMLLKKSNLPYKVIGITGVPQENEKMIRVLKYFFELLNDYAQAPQAQYTPKLDDLAYSLFFERPANYAKINNLFDLIHRNPSALRLPILISLDNNEDTSKIYYQIKNRFSDNIQHLIFIINSYEILFYMNLDYRDNPQALIAELNRSLEIEKKQGVKYQLFYSLPSEDITTYFLSYCQLMWLKKIHPHQEDVPCSLLDHLDLLVLSSHDSENYTNLLIYFKNLLINQGCVEEFTKIAGALIKYNMSYADAAKALFVHKNTVVFHMTKLKNILQIDPSRNQPHMFLFHYLYYYIQIDNKELISFQDFYNKFNMF